MKDKKILPTALAEKQELQRQETINKVLRACTDIQNEGNKVTIAALMAYTGLSRSAFSKPHTRGVLVEYGHASGDVVATKAKRKKIEQSEVIAEKDRQIAELRAKNTELEKECELLRGRLFLMMQKQILY